MTKSRRLAFTALLCGLSGLAIVPAVPMWLEWKHQKLNNTLLEAVRANNTEAALGALQQGGDAKMTLVSLRETQEPPHSLREFLRLRWEQWRHPDTLLVEEPLLPTAVDNNNSLLVKALLQRGANPNALALNSGIDDSLLWAGVVTHNPEIVGALLDAGAWVDAIDGAGDTPFMEACQEKNVPIARMLLERGADVNHNNRQGGIPLTYAIGASDPAMVALLIAHKVNVNNPYPNNTPWTHADRIDEPVIRRKIKQLLRQAGAKQ